MSEQKVQPGSVLAPMVYAAPGEVGWSPQVQAVLDHLHQDFTEVLQGRPPLHACFEQAFLDGGTTIWKAEGYCLTVMKTLFQIGGVWGILYGPVAQLEPTIGSGNQAALSQVGFYTNTALNQLLDQQAWRVALERGFAAKGATPSVQK